MKTKFNFDDVIDRAKKSLKIKNDCDIAERLGMKAGAFNARKKSNSLPFEELLTLASTEKIDFNWLLTGEGEMHKTPPVNALQEVPPCYNATQKDLDPEIQAVVTIMKKMDRAQKTTIRANAENIEQIIELKQQVSALTQRQSA